MACRLVPCLVKKTRMLFSACDKLRRGPIKEEEDVLCFCGFVDLEKEEVGRGGMAF